jgi:hypothetical protein
MELKMEIDTKYREHLIKILVDDLTKNMTYEELLENYREDLTESLELSTDEELIQLSKSEKELMAEDSINDIKRAYLLQIQLNEIIISSTTLEEADVRIKIVSDKLSIKNTKKTLDELKEIAIIDLKVANEGLKQFEGENNGNN